MKSHIIYQFGSKFVRSILLLTKIFILDQKREVADGREHKKFYSTP